MIKQCHFVRWRWRSYRSLFPRVVPVDNPSSIPAKSGPLICLPVDGGLLLFPISSVLVQPCINSVYLRRRLRVYMCVRACVFASLQVWVYEYFWFCYGKNLVDCWVVDGLCAGDDEAVENLSDFRLRDLTSSIITEDQKSLIFLVQVSNPPKVWVHILRRTQF